MFEFVVLPQINTVFGSSVGPMLGRAVGSVIGKQLGKLVEERATRKKAGETCAAAFQEWLVALINDFNECGIDEDSLQRMFPDYIDAVETYLQVDEVSAELLRPFTDPVPDPALDGRLLVNRWQALSLPALPEDFNAERACLWYVESLNQKRQAIDVLRPLWRAQAEQRRNELLEAIRGPWASWDLDRYADAMRETYQVLDITTLEPAGRYDPDAETIKLRDVFIPQHARRSRPVRILPRDYLRKAREKGVETLSALPQDASFAEDGESDAHWEKTPREPIFDILTATAPKNLVVLGDPGAGKSCLARYVALSLLEGFGRNQEQPGNAPRPWAATLAGRLPLLLELRRFLTWEAKDGEGGFLGYLHHLGSRRGLALTGPNLNATSTPPPAW